jgi:hypothetical protein
LLYLEEDRLDEAEQLFKRLDEIDRPDAYKWLGRLGQGIVFALRNQPDKSNRTFQDFEPLATSRGKTKFSPLVLQLMNENRWRDWMSRARWYNKNNGKDIVGRDAVLETLDALMPVDRDGPKSNWPRFPLGSPGP